MKLEFLPEGSDDCPLVRLYDFVPDEIVRLRDTLSALGLGALDRVTLHEINGVEPISGCRLVLRSGLRDRGLAKVMEPASFECVMSREGWQDLAAMLDPFVEESSGYQWLTNFGDARWLITSDGRW